MYSDNNLEYLIRELARSLSNPAARDFLREIPGHFNFTGLVLALLVIAALAFKLLENDFFQKLREKNMPAPQKIKGLQQGDILQFGFLPQSQISHREFEIVEVNTYIYNRKKYPEFVLKGRDNHLFYMMIEKEDGEEFVAISYKYKRLNRTNISSLQNIETITASNFNHMFGANASTHQGNTFLADYASWLKFPLHKTGNDIQGVFAEGDLRLSDTSYDEQEFTSFIFEDNEGETAIEFEIYESNEIEACVTVYHDMSCIKETWPSEQRIA